MVSSANEKMKSAHTTLYYTQTFKDTQTYLVDHLTLCAGLIHEPTFQNVSGFPDDSLNFAKALVGVKTEFFPDVVKL